MGQLVSLSEVFPQAKGCKTVVGAMQRLRRAAVSIGLQPDGSEYRLVYTITTNAKGHYIPVVFVNSNQVGIMRYLVDHGICVTNG